MRHHVNTQADACTRDAPSVLAPEIAIPSVCASKRRSPESSFPSRSFCLRVSGAVAPSAPDKLVLPTWVLRKDDLFKMNAQGLSSGPAHIHETARYSPTIMILR